MTNNDIYGRLLEAKEQKARLDKTKRRQEELRKRLREQEKLILRLKVRLDAEQADVDKLSRMSLANLFRTILGNKKEQLERERQEVLAAVLKLNEAQELLKELKAELMRLGDELAELQDAEHLYNALLAEKEATLRNSPQAAARLDEMEAQIAEQTILVQNIDEALREGKGALASLEMASSRLENAEKWGNWDVWGGEFISTFQKHTNIDEAKQFVHNANTQLMKFQVELADLKKSVKTLQIDIGSLLKLADYWFDGLIVDWIVQQRIRAAGEQILAAIRDIRSAVQQLQAERESADTVLQTMIRQRTEWLEQHP
jgi:myosin heavy subunit